MHLFFSKLIFVFVCRRRSNKEKEGATCSATDLYCCRCARAIGIWLQKGILCPASGSCHEGDPGKQAW